jgi:protocatechuate 3,4-dioxygenase beta subunit
MSAPSSPARRHLLAAAGGAAALFMSGASRTQAPRVDAPAPACVLTPAQTEGPYFVDERLRRSDIRLDPADGSLRPGALLALTLRVASVDGNGCVPLAGAIVDIWHCDAKGVYSDANDMRTAGPPQGSNSAPMGGSAAAQPQAWGDHIRFSTRGSKFLRGYQVTDGDGRVRFTTIYPGAYPGRAVHIHFKVRPNARNAPRDFTSQLYFDDALTDRVHARDPYAGAGERRTRNARDGLYRQGGPALQLALVETAEGYAATYDVGVRGG